MNSRMDNNTGNLSGINGSDTNDATMEEARQYKTELLHRLFGTLLSAVTERDRSQTGIDQLPHGSNIIGVGYGAKVTTGAIVEENAIRVYVRSKMSRSDLAVQDIIPEQINGVATDVIQVGDVRVLARPVSCGVSVGGLDATAGTLGCLVRRAGTDDGERFILSCQHVLAGTNDAKPGAPILEPGLVDGGDYTDPIAELTAFKPVDLDGVNDMDAAIARVLKPSDVQPEILGNIGRIHPLPMEAVLLQSVRKYGRTTRHTIGVVMDKSADFRVRVGRRMVAYEEQIAIMGAGGAFSDGGDSGSLILDAVSRRPVALLFAGGGNTTFANPIQIVLNHFGVEVV